MNTLEFNLEAVKNLVSTQYGDLGGLIQVDGHDSDGITMLCKDHGLDTDKYFVIGFKLTESTTTGIGQRGSALGKGLLLSKEKYGSTFDEIKNKLLSFSFDIF